MNRIDGYLKREESLGSQSEILLRDLGKFSIDAFEMVAQAFEGVSRALDQTPVDGRIAETAKSTLKKVAPVQLPRLNAFIKDSKTKANKTLRAAGEARLALWARYAQKIAVQHVLRQFRWGATEPRDADYEKRPSGPLISPEQVPEDDDSEHAAERNTADHRGDSPVRLDVFFPENSESKQVATTRHRRTVPTRRNSGIAAAFRRPSRFRSDSMRFFTLRGAFGAAPTAGGGHRCLRRHCARFKASTSKPTTDRSSPTSS
jgi:hypothetical protein